MSGRIGNAVGSFSGGTGFHFLPSLLIFVQVALREYYSVMSGGSDLLYRLSVAGCRVYRI